MKARFPGVALIVALSCPAHADDGASLSGATAYGAALSGLAASALSAYQAEINQSRQDDIRGALSRQLVASFFTEAASLNATSGSSPVRLKDTKIKPFKLSADKVLSEAQLICAKRADYAGKIIIYNYLDGSGKAVQSMAKFTPPTDLFAAIIGLFNNKSVSVAVKKPSNLAATTKAVVNACNDDIKKSFKAYYGVDPSSMPRTQQKLTAETLEAPLTAAGGLPSFSFLGPYGAAADTVIAVATPIAQAAEVAKDVASRAAAIQEFLAAHTTLDTYATKIADDLVASADNQRLRAAGAVHESYLHLVNISVDPASIPSCVALFQESGFRVDDDGAASYTFAQCWSDAFHPLQPSVDALVAAAERYDQAANLGNANKGAADPANQLKTIKGKAQDLLKGQLDGSSDLLQLADQFLSYASAASTAIQALNKQP